MKRKRRFITVDVTQGAIDLGVRGSATNCPLAIALRAAGVGPDVYVNGDTWDRGINTEEVRLTQKAERFVARFDEGVLEVHPDRFRLPWSHYLVPLTLAWEERHSRPADLGDQI